MAAPLTIDDLKRLARRRVPKMFFDYADSGSWTESTYRANEEDFARIKLRQRVLVDIAERSLESTMIGQKVSMPVALAPTGLTGMQHADGEMLAAQAAEEFGVPFTLSTMSVCSIEDVAAVTKRPFWFQLYVMRERAFVHDLIDRAKAAGCSALVLTIDLQVLGQRHKDVRNGLSTPPKFTPRHIWQVGTRPAWALQMMRTPRRTFRNIVGHAKSVTDLTSLARWTAEQFDPHLSWDDVAWIKERWGGKLILKGILDVEDAKLAAQTGADAIIVSNHGGRQLDGAPSSISVLADIAAAVGDDIEVHMDGGIRSGQDVLRALCLGAKGVYIGRPFLYGLGAGGKAGVTQALEIIRRELDTTLGFCGKRDIREAGPDLLYARTIRSAAAGCRPGPDGSFSFVRPGPSPAPAFPRRSGAPWRQRAVRGWPTTRRRRRPAESAPARPKAGRSGR
jgi:L-lactate dehydrogenase (cytochrome)